MADLVVQTRVVVSKDSIKVDFNPGRLEFALTNVEMSSGVLDIGTAEEDVPLADVATPGMVMLFNTHATAIVSYGPKIAGPAIQPFAELYPGEVAIFHLDSAATLRLVSSAANTKVQFYILSE